MATFFGNIQCKKRKMERWNFVATVLHDLCVKKAFVNCINEMLE